MASSMRLLALTIRNFRGFGPAAVPVKLDSDLVLMFGPNAYGKTSLAEAIEWLFYGTTRRRERGENYSKNEYEGCFKNVHGSIPVEVSADVRTNNGTVLKIARRMTQPSLHEGSETLINGVRTSLESLGLVDLDAVHPVVAQQDLQSFIHSRPKERRDIVSAALGLDELTTLKTALDGARKSFIASAPPEVDRARTILRPLAASLTSLPETKPLGLRWQKTAVEVSLENDIEALTKTGQRLASTDAVDVEVLLEHLRAQRQKLSQSVFDTTKLLPPSDASITLTRLSTELETLKLDCDKLYETIVKATAATTATYATILLQFWETGLGLPSEANTCPMCEDQTLTESKRALIQARLSASQAAIANNKQVGPAIGKATETLNRALQALHSASIPGFGGGDRARLEKLLPTDAGPLAAYFVAYDEATDATVQANEAAAKLSELLTKIPSMLGDAMNVPDIIANIKNVPQKYIDAATRMEHSAQRYALAWNIFEPVLLAAISSNKAVAQVDAVGKALKARGQIEILAAFDAVSLISLSLMQGTEAFLQQKQTQLLSSRGKDIKSIYDQMNPGANVAFDGMEPGTDQLRLHASSFGMRMSAAANLSECQLNCLGLSFWITRALRLGSPFGFILLDDPVQSMDDAHCEAFISSVIPDLCDKYQRQVVILSHEKRLIDRIRDLNKTRDTLVYHYDDYEKTGPSITEQVNLAVMLREVEGLAKGNEPNRSQAVDKLRKLVEQFIRELHLKQTGQPAPPQYDSAKPSELLDLFRQIPDTLPEEHHRLKDTVEFAAPAHHQPSGYSVPLRTNITPHTDRLRTLMTKYKLLI